MPTIQTQTDSASAADAVFVLAAFHLKEATSDLQKKQASLNYAEAKVHHALLEKSKALSAFEKKRKEFNIAERNYIYYNKQQSSWLVDPTQEEEQNTGAAGTQKQTSLVMPMELKNQEGNFPATPQTPSYSPSSPPSPAYQPPQDPKHQAAHHEKQHFEREESESPNEHGGRSNKRLRWGGHD